MTTRIQNLSDLQDRRIMMEKKLPAFGYALILLVAFLMVFLVIWSTQNKRTYVSQSTGSVQAANKTYIMSSYSGSITELNISEGSYVTEGDLIAHIKSTDLDIQQDSYQKQLDMYIPRLQPTSAEVSPAQKWDRSPRPMVSNQNTLFRAWCRPVGISRRFRKA